MTRLFFRFYVGVILILFVAWCIQAYVFRGTTESDNIQVVEDALGGGAISARDDLIEGGVENLDDTLVVVQERFAYPVRIVSRSDRPMPLSQADRMDRGEALLYGDKMIAAITDTDLLVELGPLPQFVGPTRSDVLIGLGSVFLLAAGSITILLRPIVKQFRTVERTALAIADGDLSARIDGGQRKQGLPIASAFNAMADRVESLLRSQKELLQAVSHELRTPLASIKFATELVRSAEDDQIRERRIDSIDEATDRLDALVGELLDYTRHDAKSESAATEVVVLQDLIAEAIELHAPLHPRIQYKTSGIPPSSQLLTYRAGMLRAISNLISNAGKYAKSVVSVSVREECDVCHIDVEDDGAGIPVSDRESIFEPFKRLEASTQPGIGLGLALVRRISTRLGGKVSVGESSLGGAKFRLSFPLDKR